MFPIINLIQSLTKCAALVINHRFSHCENILCSLRIHHGCLCFKLRCILNGTLFDVKDPLGTFKQTSWCSEMMVSCFCSIKSLGFWQLAFIQVILLLSVELDRFLFFVLKPFVKVGGKCFLIACLRRLWIETFLFWLVNSTRVIFWPFLFVRCYVFFVGIWSILVETLLRVVALIVLTIIDITVVLWPALVSMKSLIWIIMWGIAVPICRILIIIHSIFKLLIELNLIWKSKC